ncbi:hypothetical protein [Bacillus atrophaeus]|uniref:hypothetical protein n=1 Tax=Bacillus atrophaeus TaxID=1452 RepID=UPI00227F845E|nr:hypothetical protein [Bacillus atrophaeus]MCY8837704.1 hypothetical protein [Bacillus atrophaeus]
MFRTETLKNIHIKDFEEFFKEKDVKRRSARMKHNTTIDRYNMISKLIKEEVDNPNGAFTKSEINNFIFKKLFYDNNNYEYILKYSNFFATKFTKRSVAEKYLRENPLLKFNETLENTSSDKDYELFTSKLDCQSENASAIHLLVRVGFVNNFLGKVDFFAGITVDLQNSVLIVRLNYRHIKSSNKEPLKLLKEIKDLISGTGLSGKSFVPLKLNPISLDEDTANKTIFALYKELSSEAEDLLNARMTEETEDKIKEFLKETGITEIKDEYLEQIKAVLYQDISRNINPSSFKKGWIFRFDFREGNLTRATSKHEKKGPIYSSKTYWQLKELIYGEERMHEAGFHWKIPRSSDSVDVRVYSRNDTIIVHYYYNMRIDRKEKDEFVVQKIARNL